MDSYFIIEMTKDWNSMTNSNKYISGQRILAWEDLELSCFWANNGGSIDTIPSKFTRKIYKVRLEEI